VDVPAASERGIRVTNVPDANASEVASHALAMIMSLARRLPHFTAAIRNGTWSYLETGRGMRRFDQLQLGLVGFGRTGRRVAAAAAAVGFQVRAYDPLVPADAIAAAGATPAGLEEIITGSDIVSLHLPLNAETRNVIDANAIARMRDGAILVNVSRGGLVDETALAESLVAGHLSGAGLDAFESEPLPPDSPLLAIPSVLVSPHAGHYSQDSYRETIRKAFLDVARVLRGEEPVYPVN
jgi:D-3-phosphoglycerate dehydrogenase / 2-oxoglutarate reductase